MPQTTILFVHLQYDAPNSPQSRALRALAATVARTSAPPLYVVGGYAHDDFDTDSLPLAVAQAVRAAHQARTDTAMAGQLQAHVAALAAAQIPVTHSCGQARPAQCSHRWQASSTRPWCW